MRAPNPNCPVCHGKHVNVYKRQREECPKCWPAEQKKSKPAKRTGGKEETKEEDGVAPADPNGD